MRKPNLFSLAALPLLSSAWGLGGGEWPDDTNPSVFNGKTVPPPTVLNSTTFDDGLRSGNWLVEFFSPYCGHCQSFAPTWKTLYEFYYTQEPVPQTAGAAISDENDMNSFTRFYDFRFAKVDCVASGDLCSTKSVNAYPTIRFYKDGEVTKEMTGQKDLKFMSNAVETVLESIRPGSRPQGGPVLPKVGAAAADPVGANAPTAATTTTYGAAMTKDGLTVATRIPAGLNLTPNPEGKSIPLTAENFQSLVTMTPDPWFIKFYAPWCPHCKAMAPNWQGMARQMKGRLNVGEVNCDVEKRLCKDVKVRGYPTILFFRAGERIQYDGLRGLGDLINYADEAVSVCDGVQNVTAAQFEEMEKTEEVIFIYFFDHATTAEDFAALERLPMNLIGHAKLVKTNDPAMATRFKISTWPRLLVSREGKQTTYSPLMPRDMRDTRRVLDWMRTVWLPIVPELTASNAREIMDGKLVVLGILNRDRAEEFYSAKREIKNAAFEWIDKQENAFRVELQDLRDAKQSRIKEAEDRNNERALRNAKAIRINPDDIQRPHVGFAWVDGVFWERWIKTTFGISVAQGEKIVVNDEDNKRYWDVTMTGNPILPSRSSILETLRRIVSSPPKISPKRTMSVFGHAWWVIKGQILEHPFLSAGLGLLSLAAFVWWSRRVVSLRAVERGYGYFRVGEKGAGGGPMDGLLGVGSGGGQQAGKKD